MTGSSRSRRVARPHGKALLATHGGKPRNPAAQIVEADKIAGGRPRIPACDERTRVAQGLGTIPEISAHLGLRPNVIHNLRQTAWGKRNPLPWPDALYHEPDPSIRHRYAETPMWLPETIERWYARSREELSR